MGRSMLMKNTYPEKEWPAEGDFEKEAGENKNRSFT